MRPLTAFTIAAVLFGATATFAGVATPTRFSDTRRPVPEALRGVGLKSVVTEFLDPANTGLGLAVAGIVWSEVAAATSDQAGSGVVLVVSQDEKELVTLLADRYHEAALRIAGDQRARMVLWGVVEPAGEDSFAIQTYLSVLTKERGGDLRVNWNDALEAGIRRTRFNFAPVLVRKQDLTNVAIVTTVSTRLLSAPSNEAPVAATIPENTTLRATKIAGAWFEVAREDGPPAYVRGQAARIVPRSVSVSPQRIPLRARAGNPQPSDRVVNLDGSYPVSNMRELPSGTWYEIQAGGSSGWIEARRARPRRLLPAEHFVAGLYRYYDRRFMEAAREFRTFIGIAGSTESNVNLAAAWQLAGAAEVMAASVPGTHDEIDGMAAFEAFDRAVTQTPYDPTAYMLRCIADAAILRDAERAIADLDRALELDPDEPDARTLALRYRDLFSGEDPKSNKAREWFGAGRAKEKLEEMMRRHRIAPRDAPY